MPPIDIHIKRINQNEFERSAAEMIDILPDSLLEYCQRAKNKRVLMERITAYSMLMNVLEKRGKKPHECKIEFAKDGKPYLADGDVSFSISHSSSTVFLAICDGDIDIGIDAESVDSENYERMKRVVPRFTDGVFFDPLELSDYVIPPEDALTSTPTLSFFLSYADKWYEPFSPEARDAEFVIFGGLTEGAAMKWTLTEACLKMDGRGFGAIGELSDLLCSAYTYSGVVLIEGERFFISLAVEKR